MINEIPPGWKPPPKELGGESNLELCAIRLYSEVVTMMRVGSGNPNLPIAGEVKRYIADKDRIVEKMKRQGVYFHGSGGSVFMDYKIMREMASEKEGWDKIESQFSPEMTTEEAMQIARTIVSGWNWNG